MLFDTIPPTTTKVSGKITVDIYICRELRLRRNLGNSVAPEYSIIIGNAGEKVQIPLSRREWIQIINHAAANAEVVLIKEGIGYTKIGPNEVYVERVIAIKGTSRAEIITGEIETATIPKELPERAAEKDMFTLAKEMLEQQSREQGN